MTGWIVQSLAASALIILALIVLRPWLHRCAPPQLVYTLWLVPVLRLVMPALPILAPDTPVAKALPLSSALLSSATAPAIDGGAWFMLLWLGGAAAYLTVQLWRYLYFLRVVRAAAMSTVFTAGTIPVRISAAVDGPVAAGLVRREIFVPVDFHQRFIPEEQRLALAHERMHHARHDLWANLAALAVLSLHWFNPLAHYAHRLFRADQELACDADVMRRAPGQGAIYGRTLLKASNGIPALLCQLSDIALLKQRLDQLARRPRSIARGRMLAILPGAVLVVALSAATPAPPSARSRPVSRAPAASAVPGPAQVSLQSARHQRPVRASTIVASSLLVPTHLAHRQRGTPRSDAAPVPSGISDVSSAEAAQLQPVVLENLVERLFPSAADRLGNPVYLALRREQGLARSRSRYASAADTAAARGRPLNRPPPAG